MAALNRYILPVGLPLVLLIGLFLPGIGGALAGVSFGSTSLGSLLVIPIFLVYGLQTQLFALHSPGLGRAIAIVLIVNLVLAPLLGAALIFGLGLSFGLAVGVALMASVPTTMSSAVVIAVNAGGDRLWALVLTIVTVLVGSITAPLVVSVILSADAALDPVATLVGVVLVVLVPAAVGYTFARVTGWRPPAWFDAIPSLMVLTVVWMTVSANAETLWGLAADTLVAMVLLAAAVHLALLGAAAVATRGMSAPHRMPVLFVASQKTLPMALTILTIISSQEPQVAQVAGVAAIACVVWHFTQLVGDSALSGRLGARRRAATGQVSTDASGSATA